MNYRTLATIAFLFIMGTALAEGPRPPGGPNIDQLTTLLDLDAYQAQEVERIMTEHREAAEAQREAFRTADERPDRETVQAQRKELKASLRSELETVLTADQLKKLDVLHEMRGKHHPRKNRSHPPAAAVEEAA